MTNPAAPRRRRWYRWLLALPFVWQVGLIPLVNGVKTTLFSIPFPMAWQMVGIVFTTIVIAIVYRLDRQDANADHDPQ